MHSCRGAMPRCEGAGTFGEEVSLRKNEFPVMFCSFCFLCFDCVDWYEHQLQMDDSMIYTCTVDGSEILHHLGCIKPCI